MSEHQLRISHLTADVKNHKHLRIIENDSFKKNNNIKTDQFIYYHTQGFNHLCAIEKEMWK